MYFRRCAPKHPASFYYFKPTTDTRPWTGEGLRREVKRLRYSRHIARRLEWIIFYETKANKNAALTARHFGISGKTFFKFLKRFSLRGLTGLDDLSRRPHATRPWTITALEELRIRKLRGIYLRSGKMKLARYYAQEYGTQISSWKIQRVIERSGLYYHPATTLRMRRRRERAQAKKRITQAPVAHTLASLVHVDTIVLFWNNTYRYILTALDDLTRIGYARMYAHHTSRDAADFLKRLQYLVEVPIQAVHTDNGSEFAKEFAAACTRTQMARYFSRVRTPKDNARLERFNRTLQEEFIALSDTATTVDEFNQLLTEWLILYNFKRPHQSLAYLTPMAYADTIPKPLPMYPSSTNFCFRTHRWCILRSSVCR